MEIPGNEFRINKNRPVQETRDVKSKRADTGKTEGAPATSGGEQIALSSKARDIQRAHEAINTAPDIRTEKVNRIKEAIANNEYEVPSDVLAERILKEIITESRFVD